MTTIEVKLDRIDRLYAPGDDVKGQIVISSPTRISHYGIMAEISGNVTFKSKSSSVIDSLYGGPKPLPLVYKRMEVLGAGKLNAGPTQVPFEFVLEPIAEGEEQRLYDTFHGCNVNVQYSIFAEIGMMFKVSTRFEFIVEGNNASVKAGFPKSVEEENRFAITEGFQTHELATSLRSGGFRITGSLPTTCSVSEPLHGHIIVEHSRAPILSIDVQITRVESIHMSNSVWKESSLVQSTQIADGDVCRGLSIPIYIILPRLYVSPTVQAKFGLYALSTVYIWFYEMLTSLEQDVWHRV